MCRISYFFLFFSLLKKKQNKKKTWLLSQKEKKYFRVGCSWDAVSHLGSSVMVVYSQHCVHSERVRTGEKFVHISHIPADISEMSSHPNFRHERSPITEWQVRDTSQSGRMWMKVSDGKQAGVRVNQYNTIR